MDRKKDRGDDGQARAKSGLRTFEIVWDTISCLCLMLAGSAFQPRDALTLLLEAGFVDLAVTLVCLHAPVRPVPSLAAVLAVARPHHAARRAQVDPALDLEPVFTRLTDKCVRLTVDRAEDASWLRLNDPRACWRVGSFEQRGVS